MARRLLISLGTILAAVTLTFILVRNMPGDILHSWALQIQAQQGISYEQARLQAQTMLNFDPTVPLWQQYARYLWDVLRGDLGQSLTYRIPVATILRHALPWTLFVALLSTVFSFTVGVLVGAAAAWRQGSGFDRALTAYATVTQAIPDFLLGLLLMVAFAVLIPVFPMRGAYTDEPGFTLDVLYHAVLPVMALSVQSIGTWALAMRASATGVLAEDYLQLARAKGLVERRLIVDYVGRNSVLPLIPGLAIQLGGAVGGAMLVETLFGYPGIGYFFAQAIATRDYGLMQGLFLVTTVSMVLANLAADLLVRRLDPRVR